MPLLQLRPKNLFTAPQVRVLSAARHDAQHDAQDAAQQTAQQAAQHEVRLAVDGLVCSVCAARVQSALERLPGVRSAECSLATGQAHVQLELDAPAADWSAAVEGVVILPRLRRWLSRVSRA